MSARRGALVYIAALLFSALASRPARATDTKANPAIRMQEGSGRADLDGDGTPDCWRLGYDGGTGYGWWSLALRPSCGKRSSRIRLGGSFGSFCAMAALPPELSAQIVDGLVDRWFGAGRRRVLSKVDGSLWWLLERYQDRAAMAPSSRRWTRPRRYTPRWQAGQPELPPEQVVVLRDADEQRLARAAVGAMQVDGDPRISGPALLVYDAYNHDKLTEAGRAGGFTVFLTAHALAVRDDARGVWSWAYVGTDQIKLRWPTAVRAETDGTLVAFERWVQDDGDERNVRELVVIDPRAGRFAARRLRARERWSLEPSLRRVLEPPAP